MSGVFHTCYLYLKKEEWKKGKKTKLLQQNAILLLDSKQNTWFFRNSRPLASLRLKNTWGGALISVDLYKITLFYILFLSFYNGHIFGGLINGATFVLIIWWAYIRGFDLIFQAFSKIVLGQFLDKKKF